MLSKRVNASKSKETQQFPLNHSFYSQNPTDSDSNPSANSMPAVANTLNEKVLVELKDVFGKLISFLPQLRLAGPYEYERILSDILLEQFNHDDVAIRGFISVIINSMDKTIITEYIDRAMRHEAKQLETESPFRMALMRHHSKWLNEVMYTGPDIYKANVTRRIELATLKSALDANQYQFKGQQKPLKLFPDDDLIKVVESIIAKGKTFSTELCGLPIASSLSFDDFLSELKTINLQRLDGKLKAHSPTILGSKTDLTSLLRALLIQQDKILRTPSYHQYHRASTLAKQSEAQKDLVAGYIDEKCQQEQKIRDLEQALAEANKRAEELDLVKQEYNRLKRMNTQLRQENAYLTRQIVRITQESHREGVLSILKKTLSVKPQYAQYRLFEISQTAPPEIVKNPNGPENNTSSLIAFDDTQYYRQCFDQDVGTPFSVFGLTREQAYLLLMRNIHEVRESMKWLLLELLTTNEDFVKSLPHDYAGLKAIANQFFEAKKLQVSNLDDYARPLELYKSEVSLLDAYIDYDLHCGRVDKGWCHPVILGALASLLDIDLKFYKIDVCSKMTLHPDFQEYGVPEPKQLIELLIIHGYHFERVVPLVTMIAAPQHNNSTQNDSCSYYG